MATQLNTRILLRYDTYENWVKDNATVLLAGEVAICTVPSTGYPENKVDAGVTVQNPPKTLMKVGPGAFKDLPWLSAVAADVHTWAKKSEGEFKAWLTSTEGPALATNKDLTDLASRVTNIETDLNTATTGLKARMTSVEGRATNLENDLNTASTGLKARMTAAESDIDNLQTAIGTGENGLGARVTALEGRAADIESVNTQQGKTIGEHTTAIENITKADGLIATAVKGEADRAKEVEEGLQGAIDILNGGATEAGSVAKAVKDAVDAEKSRAESAESGLETKINGVSTVANRADALAADNKSRLDTLVPTTDNGKTVRAIAAEEINTLIGAADDEGGETIQKVADLVDYVEKNGGQIAGLINTVNGHTESLSGHAGAIKALQDKDVEIVEDIQDINNTIGTDTLATTAKTLIGAINEVNTAVGAGDEATLAAAKKHTNDAIAALSTGEGAIATLTSTVNDHTSKLAGLTRTTVKAEIDAAQAAAEQKVTDLANGQVKTNKEAIDAINHTSTGILAQATKYADDKMGTVAEGTTLAGLIADETSAREAFDKTALTGKITTNANSENELAISLDGTKLDLVFNCGGAKLN
jgi:hypothetical protein